MKTILKIATVLLSACIANAVTVGWNQTADQSVIGYRLYQGGATHVYTNHTDVPGRTTTITTVTNLAVGATYFFALSCYTAGGQESTFSNEISYTVPLAVPVIVTQPVGSTNQTGATVSFSVTATGVGLSYQWFKNGAALTTATNSVISISSVTWVNNGNYTVTVSNTSGSITSSVALLAVIPLPPTGLTVGP